MDQKELEKFQKKLVKLKEEILFVLSKEDESDNSKGSHEDIDRASDAICQQMGSMMSNNFHKNRIKVNEALKRIEKKEYGKCFECGLEISLKRLNALPLSEYCIQCQTELENDD